MKNIVRSIFAVLFLLISNSISAQFVNPITVVDATSPNACDGSATINNPNNVILNTVVWYMNGAVYQQGATSITNLCSGNYSVFYYTPIDSVYATFIISGNPCNGFQVMLSGTQASTPTSMDGTVTVSAIGGSAPYIYQWSTGNTTSVLTNVPVGMYSCCVTDASGCMSCDSFNVVASINPGNDTVLIINNNNIPNVIDSLGTQAVLDCSLDYNAVGGAYIIASNYTQGGGPALMDTITLTWQVVDTLVPPTVLATYSVPYLVNPPLVAAYTASLQVYCPVKNTNYNTLLAIDQFYSAQLGIEEAQYVPSICIKDGCANMDFSSLQNGEFTVYAINGSVMYQNEISSQSTMKFEVSKWESGIYLLHYSFTNGSRGVVRFVKP
jgi:hypothetical protein